MQNLQPKVVNMLRREARLWMGTTQTQITEIKPGLSQDILEYTATGKSKKTGETKTATFRVHLKDDLQTPCFIFDEALDARVWRDWSEIPDA